MKESGSVTIDGTKYFIKSAPTTSNDKTVSKVAGASEGKYYVVVGSVNLD